MHFQLNELYLELHKHEKIIIYGIGEYARAILPKLFLMGLKERIQSFCVTMATETKEIDGVSVVGIGDVVSDENTVFLLAVNKQNAKQIEAILIEKRIYNYVLLSDYEVNLWDVNILSEKEWKNDWIKHIKEWYVFERGKQKDICDNKYLEEIFCNMISVRKCNDINRQQIVFIVGFMSPRIIKIMDALKRKDYSLILLDYCNEELEYLQVEKIGVKYKKCRSIEELLYEALKYNPLVYYFRPRWADCAWANVMLELKETYGKIVLDIHDVMKGSYANATQKQLESERNALENADGIVWRYYAKEYLEERCGYRFSGKSIQFSDCCQRENLKIEENTNERVRICYVSGHIHDMFCGYKGDINVIHHSNIWDIMDKLGNNPRCEFSVFTGIITELEQECLDSLVKKYDNFDYFCNVKMDILLEQLSMYDYGCFFTSGKIVEEQDFHCENGRDWGIHVLSVTNRYFDYLDAGLPIITQSHQYQCDELKKYGVIVDMGLDILDLEELVKKRNEYKKNVLIAQKKLHIDNQINYLIDFINTI